MAGKHEQTVVARNEVRVMFKRTDDAPQSITRVWAELDEAVGSLRGRRFYGTFDPRTTEYRACVELRDEDDPIALGLEPGTLPGARVRLQGERPAVYSRIAPAFEALAQRPDCDRGRPTIEFYRRRDVIDLLEPVV